jgi:riboflavin synthase
MFSGIVAAIGRIDQVERRAGGVRLTIDAGKLALRDVTVGDSVSVGGVCLTVVGRERRSFSVDVSRETLRCTTGLDDAGPVNLEKALRFSDRLGGHLVSGHVDGVGEITLVEPKGASRVLRVRAPRGLIRYVARKGSIAVHGVSLTVNAVRGAEFEVNLIPHTLAATTFQNLRAGDRVNLEVDLLARYAERLLRRR